MTIGTVRLLTHEGADRSAWLNAWEAAGREPFAHPDFVAIFAGSRDTPHVALVDTAHGTVLIPLVVRRIPEELAAGPTQLADASSPYGYGGPYGSPPEALAEAWGVLAQNMKSLGLVSLFGRLALDAAAPAQVPGRVSVRSSADNVVVGLHRSEEEQWTHYEHKVRKNVKKALRAGLTMRVAESFTDIDEFSALYAATMERRGAAAWYRFDREFFANLTDRLPGSYVAAEVRDAEGVLVSAELVLASDAYLYSFLGGTLPQAFPHAPNDLLKHEVINYGRRTGRVGYVLGGGYAANDGIFKYKRSFDVDGVVPFQRVEIIGDPAAYVRLVEQRASSMVAAGDNPEADPGFFPAYRAPAVPKEPSVEAAKA